MDDWPSSFQKEPIQDANTVDEMRAEIFRLRFHDPMVRASFDVADYNGKSGEDKYAILAYHLLKQNRALLSQNLEMLSTAMPKHIVTRSE